MFEIDIASSVPFQYAFLKSPVKRGIYFGKFFINSFIYFVILRRVSYNERFKAPNIRNSNLIMFYRGVRMSM